MKILICAEGMGIGGAQTHILTLAGAFVAMGHRVTVASSGGAYVERLTQTGAEHLLLPLNKKDVASVARSRSAIHQLAVDRKFDIVAAHGRIPAFVCGRLRRDPAFPPLVVTAHGFFRENFILDRLSEWGCHTIAVSSDVRDHLTDHYGLPAEDITVIRSGVALSVPEHRPDRELRITTVSRMDGDTAGTALLLCRVIPVLREKFPALAPRLIIVGGGSRIADVREAARAASAECPGLVTVVGNTTELPAIYARTDVFVGAARSAMEAMAAGLPVVLCSNEGCAGVLDETNIRRAEENNFTCRGERTPSAELLGRELERLLSMSGRERANLGQFGRKYISVYGSAEKMAEETLAVYAAMIEKYKGGITLCGSFSRGNVGEAAELESVLDAVSGIAPGVTPAAPAPLRAALPEGVRRIPLLRPFAVRRELKKTRLFILCGGKQLQNGSGMTSLRRSYHFTRLAAKFGARIIIWGGGVGPITGEKARMMAACCAEYADEVCLRDPDSRALLEKMSVDTSCMNVTADAAMMTLPVPLPPELALKNNTYFAVSVRPLSGPDAGEKQEKVISAIADAAVTVFEKYHYVPVWIPYAPEDVRLVRELSRRCGAGVVMPLMTPGEVVGVLSSCTFALGMRLHQSVFASCAGIPSLGVAADAKLASFAAYAKQPPAMNPDAPDFSAAQIAANVGRLLGILPRAQTLIRARTAELREACTFTSAAAADLYRWEPAREDEDAE